ncbi:MAG: YidC/Oxa1 family insertase periplasmic-domain containing protein, partial [Mucilaginibacter sp.]
MDKNTYTGFFLIVLIMLGSYFLLKPSDADIKKEKLRQHQDSLKKASTKNTSVTTAKFDSTQQNTKVDSALLKSPFGAASVGSEQFVTLENHDLLIKLSTKGGRVYSVQLKNYKTFDGKPLILFEGNNNKFGLNFRAQDKPINTNNLYFNPSAPNLTVAAKDSGSVTMRLSYSPTQYIDYV